MCWIKNSLPFSDNMVDKKFTTIDDNIYNNNKKKNNTKIEKIEIIKKKNIFLKTGFIQNKKVINKLNNINTNLTNNLALSYKLNKNNLMMNNFN